MLNNIQLLSVLAVTLLSLGTLTACHTIEGAGEDIEAAGDKIEETASDNKNY